MLPCICPVSTSNDIPTNFCSPYWPERGGGAEGDGRGEKLIMSSAHYILLLMVRKRMTTSAYRSNMEITFLCFLPTIRDSS